MWRIKHFKTMAEMIAFADRHYGMQWTRIFVNNKAFSMEYKLAVKPRMAR